MVTTPTDKWIDIDGLEMHYRDWGGSGQSVVMLHGLASTCHIWDLVAPVLARDFRIFALDQRGHGETAKPDTGYDFATVGRDLHGFIEALDIGAPVLVGHSWGGDVALEYSITNPEVPKGLVFVDGGMIDIASRPDMTLERAKEEMAPPVWKGVTAEEFRNRMRSWKFAEWPNSAGLEEIVMANFETLPDNTIQSRLSRDNHLRIIEALWDHKPSELYSKLGVPVLIMPARQRDDGSVEARRFRREESVERASKLIPESNVVWLEDSVHDVPLQRPELVASVISEHLKNGFFKL